MSHLEDVITVKLVLLACQLKIIRVVLQLQHKKLNIIRSSNNRNPI